MMGEAIKLLMDEKDMEELFRRCPDLKTEKNLIYFSDKPVSHDLESKRFFKETYFKGKGDFLAVYTNHQTSTRRFMVMEQEEAKLFTDKLKKDKGGKYSDILLINLR